MKSIEAYDPHIRPAGVPDETIKATDTVSYAIGKKQVPHL